MNVISNNLLSYYNGILDFDYYIDNMNLFSNVVYNDMKSGIYNFKNINNEYISQFPIYQNMEILHLDLKKYDLNKIYNITFETEERIKNYLYYSEVIHLFKNVEKIKDTKEKIYSDYYYQHIIPTSASEIYNIDENIDTAHNGSTNTPLFNLFEFDVDDAANQAPILSAIYNIFLVEYLYNIYKLYLPVEQELFEFILDENNEINKENYITDFNNFMLNHLDELVKLIVDNYCLCLYSFLDISENLKQKMYNKVRTIMFNKLEEIFDSVVKKTSNPMQFDTSTYICKLLFKRYAYESVRTSMIYQGNQVVNTDYDATLQYDEQSKYDEWYSKYNVYNIKDYHVLIFSFKNEIAKFLNVVPTVLTSYVYDKIKTPDDYIYNESDIAKIFTKCLNAMNSEFILPYLNSHITSQKMIEMYENSNCLYLANILVCDSLFNKFYTDKNISSLYETISHEIFQLLKKEGHVEHDFYWCDQLDNIENTLKIFFKKYIYSNTIFPTVIEKIDTMVHNTFSNKEFKLELEKTDLQIIREYMLNTSTVCKNIATFYDNIFSSTLIHDLSLKFYNYFSV